MGVWSKGERSGPAKKKGRGMHSKITRFPPIAMLLRRLVRSDHVMELLIKESCEDPDRLERLVSLIMRREKIKSSILNNDKILNPVRGAKPRALRLGQRAA